VHFSLPADGRFSPLPPTRLSPHQVVKPTVQEAIDFIQKVEASLDVPIDPLPAKAK
jgi:hypothetical protein